MTEDALGGTVGGGVGSGVIGGRVVGGGGGVIGGRVVGPDVGAVGKDAARVGGLDTGGGDTLALEGGTGGPGSVVSNAPEDAVFVGSGVVAITAAVATPGSDVGSTQPIRPSAIAALASARTMPLAVRRSRCTLSCPPFILATDY